MIVCTSCYLGVAPRFYHKISSGLAALVIFGAR